ncbi:hypothetical protein BaRGS_00018547, partial [Batillaria attramentaria]
MLVAPISVQRSHYTESPNDVGLARTVAQTVQYIGHHIAIDQGTSLADGQRGAVPTPRLTLKSCPLLPYESRSGPSGKNTLVK